MMSNFERFRDDADMLDFPAGETIFHEGDSGARMYVVISGSVRLSVMGRPLEKVGPGGVFGEMALIDAAPRSATAVALTLCTLVPISAERFTTLIQETPGFALEIMKSMAVRLRSMDRRV
jgi:CRP/FNR family transcriptional regulator, cyclic AMP receptor protein